jgi:hypothetical protein
VHRVKGGGVVAHNLSAQSKCRTTFEWQKIKLPYALYSYIIKLYNDVLIIFYFLSRGNKISVHKNQGGGKISVHRNQGGHNFGS